MIHITIHVVRSGESVDTIAAYYGVDPFRLASDNAVPPSGALAVGQTLVVRFPRQVHAVRSGETLASIAASYGTTIRQLWRNNWFLGGNSLVQPGQTLVISYFEERLGIAASNGYAYPFIDQPLLSTQLPYLTHLTPFTYGITADGGLLPLNDDALLAAARQRGTLPVMHLSTLTEDDRFDTGLAELVLSDTAAQNRLIGEVLQTALRKGYAGVDVDFEYLPGNLAASYAGFLSRLHRLLGAHGLFLWAALAPKTSPQQRGLLYEGHSYPAIGASVDAVLLMTYEWRTLAHNSILFCIFIRLFLIFWKFFRQMCAKTHHSLCIFAECVLIYTIPVDSIFSRHLHRSADFPRRFLQSRGFFGVLRKI